MNFYSRYLQIVLSRPNLSSTVAANLSFSFCVVMQVKTDAVHKVLAPGTHKCANSSHLRPLLHAFLKAKIFPFVCRFFPP